MSHDDRSDAETMSPVELEKIASRVFGYGWQTKLAAHLEISDRSVRRFVSGQQPIPPGVAQQVRTLVSITPPTDPNPDNDRDQECRRAIYPHLDALATQAQAAGWDIAEILAATVAWAAQNIIDVAGHEVARGVLLNASDEIEADAAGKR